MEARYATELREKLAKSRKREEPQGLSVAAFLISTEQNDYTIPPEAHTLHSDLCITTK